jgi:hypothetical protein
MGASFTVGKKIGRLGQRKTGLGLVPKTSLGTPAREVVLRSCPMRQWRENR